jgi:CheY-like chemotaxis protein
MCAAFVALCVGRVVAARWVPLQFGDARGGVHGGRRSSVAAGPGVALARAYAPVRDWGGDIAVENLGPSGNTFAIYLPYLDGPPKPTAEAPAVLTAAPPPLPERLRETILVADDEPGIRGLIRKILRRERYNVLEAGSADEALTVALSQAGPIQLLLTDVIMPSLEGPELARRMSEASPDRKVLFISEYTGEESVLPDQLPREQGSRICNCVTLPPAQNGGTPAMAASRSRFNPNCCATSTNNLSVPAR